MSTGVQITLIICFTLVAVIWISAKYGLEDKDKNKTNKKK